VSDRITEVLQLPAVVKEPALRKPRRVLGARCITENEFLNELRQKEEKRENELKEMRKKEREEKKQRKELEKLKKKLGQTGKKSKRKSAAQTSENVPITTATVNEQDDDNCCTYCGGYYYDDESDDEDWIKCRECDDWYHEFCTGKFGCQLDQFVCDKH
jgi:hypothetical protein